MNPNWQKSCITVTPSGNDTALMLFVTDDGTVAVDHIVAVSGCP
jgi:hypothetical protein